MSTATDCSEHVLSVSWNLSGDAVHPRSARWIPVSGPKRSKATKTRRSGKCSRCGVKTKLRLRDRIYRCRNGWPPLCRDLNAAINLARLGDPNHGGTGTGTGSRPAASGTVGDGRGAIQKTSPTTTPGAMGTAGGDEMSTPHTTNPVAGTATPQSGREPE